jgi:TRAP-type transport system small permease protein
MWKAARKTSSLRGFSHLHSLIEGQYMYGFVKVTDYLVRVLRIIGGACLAGMMLITCTDVVLRAFGHPIFGSIDVVKFLAVLVLACAMPITHREGGHIGVDLLVQKFSPRTQSVVDSITSLVALVLFAVVSWEMWLYARELAIKGEVSMTIEIPVYPFIYCVSICFGIFCLTILVDLINHVRKAAQG